MLHLAATTLSNLPFTLATSLLSLQFHMATFDNLVKGPPSGLFGHCSSSSLDCSVCRLTDPPSTRVVTTHRTAHTNTHPFDTTGKVASSICRLEMWVLWKNTRLRRPGKKP